MTDLLDLDPTTAAPFDMWAVNITADELTRPAAELLAAAEEAERNAQDNDREADRWRAVIAQEERVMAHLETDRRRAHRKATRKDRPNRHAAGRAELAKITEERMPRQRAAIDAAAANLDHHTRDAARLRAVADAYRTAATAQTTAQEAPRPAQGPQEAAANLRRTGCTWPSGIHAYDGGACTRCGAQEAPQGFRHDPTAPTPGLDADGRPDLFRITTPAAPIPVELVWMREEDGRLGGMIQLGRLGRADAAAVEASGKEDQAHIDGGRRRATIDAFSDYDPADQWHLTRVTPEAAARHLADWLGFTGRPITLTVIDETRM